MEIHRIVPDLHSSDMEQSKKFYGKFLGLSLEMDLGWISTFASSSNPTAQVSLLKTSRSIAPQPDISIEVEDSAKLYAEAIKQELEIVYPLTEEPWGVRRFFVRDPDGYIVNVVSHMSE